MSRIGRIFGRFFDRPQSGAQSTETPGVYTRLEDLVRLQNLAKGFSFLPHQPAGSVLAGRRASRIRGRGLDFEELRAYLPGDDVRSIDWKVTARTGKPHTRIYTEERERSVLLVIDQRLAMFFGTRSKLKSVAAAELSALIAWQAFTVADRIGAVVFNDQATQEIEPRRSRKNVLRILEAVTEQNRSLALDQGLSQRPERLDAVLEGVARRAAHDWLIIIVSDFHGAGAETHRIIQRMARHNDVVAAVVHDPAAYSNWPSGRYVVSDAALQIEMDLRQPELRESYADLWKERVQRLRRFRDELGVPNLSINTEEDVAVQLRRAMGIEQAASR